MIVLVPVPPGRAGKLPLEAALNKFLTSTKQRRQHWTRTPPERGMVNGVPFVRAHWSAIEPASGRKMHGFSYLAITGPNLVHIASQDVDPHHRTSLKLAEAAALTFPKR